MPRKPIVIDTQRISAAAGFFRSSIPSVTESASTKDSGADTETKEETLNTKETVSTKKATKNLKPEEMEPIEDANKNTPPEEIVSNNRPLEEVPTKYKDTLSKNGKKIGRPRTGINAQQFTLTCEPIFHDRIVDAAKKQGKNVSAFIRDALEYYIDTKNL